MSSPTQKWVRVRTGDTTDFTILKIREDTFSHPRDDSQHPRVVMEVPDWVNVIAVTKDEEILFVRQFRPGIEELTLEIPGGIVDPGESPAEAAARELEEETGYRAQKLTPLGFTHANPAWQNNRAHTFLAEGCERVHGGKLDEGEDLSLELHPARSVPQMFRDGAITHAIIAGAFWLAQLHGVAWLSPATPSNA